jgi:hypothetical protein
VDYETVIAGIVRTLEQGTRPELLMIKTLKGDPSLEPILSRLGFIEVPFLDRTRLSFPFTSFEEYRSSRSKNVREQIRQHKKSFERAGGRLVRSHDLTPYADTITELCRRVEAEHSANRDIDLPFPVSRQHLLSIDCLPQVQRLLILAQIGGAWVGCVTAVIDRGVMYWLVTGLDYDISVRSCAYFNLIYELFAVAAEQHVHTIYLGLLSYETKCRLGAVREQTRYHVLTNNRILRLALGLIARQVRKTNEAN